MPRRSMSPALAASPASCSMSRRSPITGWTVRHRSSSVTCGGMSRPLEPSEGAAFSSRPKRRLRTNGSALHARRRSRHRSPTRPRASSRRSAIAVISRDRHGPVVALIAPTHTSRIAVLASGGGSNLGAVVAYLDARGSRRGGDVVLVASDRAAAGALARARARGIDASHIPDPADGDAIEALLREHHIDLIVLAGYLRLVPPAVTRRFGGRRS